MCGAGSVKSLSGARVPPNNLFRAFSFFGDWKSVRPDRLKIFYVNLAEFHLGSDEMRRRAGREGGRRDDNSSGKAAFPGHVSFFICSPKMFLDFFHVSMKRHEKGCTTSRFGAGWHCNLAPKRDIAKHSPCFFPPKNKNHPSQIWAEFVHACWPGTLLSWGERWAIFLACFLLLSPYYAQLERRKEAKKSPLRCFFLSFPLSCEIYAQGAQKNILSRLRELIGWETKRQSSLPHFYRITLLCTAGIY